MHCSQPQGGPRYATRLPSALIERMAGSITSSSHEPPACLCRARALIAAPKTDKSPRRMIDMPQNCMVPTFSERRQGTARQSRLRLRTPSESQQPVLLCTGSSSSVLPVGPLLLDPLWENSHQAMDESEGCSSLGTFWAQNWPSEIVEPSESLNMRYLSVVPGGGANPHGRKGRRILSLFFGVLQLVANERRSQHKPFGYIAIYEVLGLQLVAAKCTKIGNEQPSKQPLNLAQNRVQNDPKTHRSRNPISPLGGCSKRPRSNRHTQRILLHNPNIGL
jgi:hypothetical protein